MNDMDRWGTPKGMTYKIRTCPKCGRSYSEPPALSREDNKTEICPDCGTREALEAFAKANR